MRMRLLIPTLVLMAWAAFAECGRGRQKRLLPIFEIVQFANDECVTEGANANRGGTCYTADECNRRGTASGTCASGYGVCCVVILGCGQESSDNQTYLIRPSQGLESPCSYRICKADDDICRIRLDFNTLVIAGPQLGTVSDYGTTGVPNSAFGGSLGDCVTDTFTVTAPGHSAPPIICGFNSGQHMIVDASDDCHEVSVSLGSGAVASRQWDIKVTQYECGNEAGGPRGCLQYFTGTSGTNVASFNFPTNAATVGATVTHLSNQDYTMCFRQEANVCAICFSTVISMSTGPENQASFGLSVSSGTNVNSVLDGACTEDYLQLSNAEDGDALMIGTFVVGKQRICGRAFNVLADSFLDKSVCTQTTPFRLSFKTNSNEVTTTDEADGNEQDMPPGGIIGFNLKWSQVAC